MVYLLYGDDDFSIKEALEEIKASLGGGEMLGLNTTVLDGGTITFNELKAVCDTVPFLAPVRLVIVSDLLSQLESRPRGAKAGTAGGPSDAWGPLVDYLRDKAPDTTVLALLDGPLKSGGVLQQVRSIAKVKQFGPVRGAALEAWIRDRVSRHGGRIAASAVKLLSQLVGEDLWAMSSEIEKLAIYCQGQEVQEKDVKAVTTQARETSIFSLVDAVAEGRAAQGVGLLEELLEEGFQPPYILFMITRQYRLIIQAQEARREIKESRKLGEVLGVTSEFALRKVLDQARRHTRDQLDRIYRHLLETDASIKRGWLPADVALELLIPELCSTAGTGQA